MNCDGIKELLSEGRPLTGAAEHHVASCVGCREMLEALTTLEAPLDQQQIHRFQQLVAKSLKPVRPLPSDRKLIWTFLGLFTAFSLVAAIPFGYYGFRVLSPYQRTFYYGILLLLAILFAVATAHEMIPGSKRRINSSWLILAAACILPLLVFALFPDFEVDRFAALGIPCLRLGLVCALLSGSLLWLVSRKGFFLSPVAGVATVGLFAGLAGVAVLALHCPIHNWPHIVAWHLGAMALGGVGGTIFGTIQKRRTAN
jgi:hypothetical protein